LLICIRLLISVSPMLQFFVCKYTISCSVPNIFTSVFLRKDRIILITHFRDFSNCALYTFPRFLLFAGEVTKISIQRREIISNLSALLPPEVLFYFGIQHGIIAVIVLEDETMFEEGDTGTDVEGVGQVMG